MSSTIAEMVVNSELLLNISGMQKPADLGYVLFVLSVRSNEGKLGSKQWTVKKRFTEFHALRQTLITSGIDTYGIPFPEKIQSVFGLSAQQLEERRSTLEAFLKALLARPMPMTEMKVVREFLGASARALYVRDLMAEKISRDEYEQLIEEEDLLLAGEAMRLGTLRESERLKMESLARQKEQDINADKEYYEQEDAAIAEVTAELEQMVEENKQLKEKNIKLEVTAELKLLNDTKVGELEGELQQCQKKLAEAEAVLPMLRTSLDKAEAEAQKFHDGAQAAQDAQRQDEKEGAAAFISLESKLKRAESKLQRSEHSCKALEQQAELAQVGATKNQEEAERTNKLLKEEAERANKTLREMQQAIDAAANKSATEAEELSEIRAQLRRVQRQMEEASSEADCIPALELDVKRMSRKLEEAESEAGKASELRAELARCEERESEERLKHGGRVRELEESVERSDRESRRYREEAAMQVKRVELLQSELADVRLQADSNASAAARAKALEMQLVESTTGAVGLEGKTRQLQLQLDDLRRTAELDQTKQSEMQRELESKLAQAQIQVQSQAQAQALAQAHAHAQAQAQGTEEKMSWAARELALQEQNRQLGLDLKDAEQRTTQLPSLEMELETLKTQSMKRDEQQLSLITRQSERIAQQQDELHQQLQQQKSMSAGSPAAELPKLQAEISSFRNQSEKLEGLNAVLEARLQGERDTVAATQGQLTMKQQRVEDLEAKLGELTNQAQSLAQEKNTDTKATLQQLDESKAALAAAVEEHRSEVEQHTRVRLRVDDLEHQLKQKQEELTAVQAQVCELLLQHMILVTHTSLGQVAEMTELQTRVVQQLTCKADAADAAAAVAQAQAASLTSHISDSAEVAERQRIKDAAESRTRREEADYALDEVTKKKNGEISVLRASVREVEGKLEVIIDYVSPTRHSC
jgi:hypothetical protein